MERQQDTGGIVARLNPVQLTLGLSLAGGVIALLAPAAVALALLAVLVSLSVGLSLAAFASIRSTGDQPKLLQLWLELARDRDVSKMQMLISEALSQIANRGDPIFRRVALQRLQSVGQQCQLLGEGTIEFSSTESWRIVYEELLRSPGLHLYRSVAYIESRQYWQDDPGRQSTMLNLELQDSGVVSIERTAIVADHLWDEGSLFPVDPIHSWLDQQHRHGIWIRLLRESAVGADTDLLGDFGIYGNRATGTQIADPTGKTVRFLLSFDFDKVVQAEQRWERLAVYARPYRDLLEQQH